MVRWQNTVMAAIAATLFAGSATAADGGLAMGDGERTVSVISEYRPADGTVVIGGAVFRLSPEAAGSLAEQTRGWIDKNKPFGAAVIFGPGATGQPSVTAIRVFR